LITVALFFLDRLLLQQGIYYNAEVEPGMRIKDVPPGIGLGHFSIGLSLFKWELWRLFTWPFVHANLWHVLVNVASLHFFGPVLESHYGSRRFLVFYILCGLGGLITYALLWQMNYLIPNEWVPMFGASAPVLGLLVAATHVAPDAKATVYDLFPVHLRTIALALLGLAFYTMFTYGRAAFSVSSTSEQVIPQGGALAHLGGALMGFVLIRSPQWVRLFDWHPFRRPPPF
jgi:membrane associated rhomboid family serine protease